MSVQRCFSSSMGFARFQGAELRNPAWKITLNPKPFTLNPRPYTLNRHLRDTKPCAPKPGTAPNKPAQAQIEEVSTKGSPKEGLPRAPLSPKPLGPEPQTPNP